MTSSKFKIIQAESMADNIFKLIGKEWMLATAGTPEKYNCMTVSWGGMGILWSRPVAFVFIRPNRYTFEFTEKNSSMSLCVFDEKYKPILNLCGTQSGRNIDKMHLDGLSIAFSDQGIPFYQEARIVFLVRKLYSQFLDHNLFIEPSIRTMYNGSDYHKMYVCEIEKIMVHE